MVAVIVIVSLFAYFVAGGFTYKVAEKEHRARCHAGCSKEVGGRTGSYHEPEIGWFFIGILWPPAIALYIGMFLSGNSNYKLFDRADRRRAKELAEAKHQAELARIKAQEQFELDRQLEYLKRIG